jgi:hypothetical protein
MGKVSWWTVFLSVLIISIQTTQAARVALVVGNSTYQNVPQLENPKHDAKLVADTLRDLGFVLIGGAAQLDLDKTGLDSMIQKFGTQLRGAEVGLFYYAGHGVQVRGSNYLVPIGANPTREADVDFQMVDINLVLRQMEGSGTRLNLVILDACRNNPFGGRGLRATGGGLAQMQAPEGTLISYATQPGNVAQDGTDGNSPYSKALAQTIRRGGLDIFGTFNAVGLAVKRSTGGSQQPWLSSSPIEGTFYFADTPPTAPAAAVSPAPPAPASPVAVVSPTPPTPNAATPVAAPQPSGVAASSSPPPFALAALPNPTVPIRPPDIGGNQGTVELECSKQADAKGLHGQERKDFRTECKAHGGRESVSLTIQECAVKYRAAKDAGTLNGRQWNDFRKVECGAQNTDRAVFPSAIAPQYSREEPGRARMHTCLDSYNANKATNGNGGLKWIDVGGGYYSECNTKLKG